MTVQASSSTLQDLSIPLLSRTVPVLYEDEDEGEMGESSLHVGDDEILHVCVAAHLAGTDLRAFSNMNLYYLPGPPHPRTGSRPYVSPDLMVVRPIRDLGPNVSSFTIGQDGPAPLSVSEILSKRSAQQRDLKEKIDVYAFLAIPEYILVDSTARFLPEKLLLKKLQLNGSYEDVQDPDGGVTSQLGFRVIFDSDGKLRVLDAATGKRYVRPDEAQAEADARLRAEKELQEAQERIKALEQDLARARKKKPGK